MKAWSVIGLLCAATIFAMVPISPQVTSRGVELSVDQAQAVTYRRARVTARRAYRGAAYAVGAGAVGYGIGAYYGGYGYPAYSAPSAPYYGTGYGSYYGGYSYPTYSYPSYGYPAYGYGGYYRPGYRVARRVAIHRARWR